MYRRFLKTAFGLAAGLVVAATPGYCTAVLSFSTWAASGTAVVTSGVLTSLSGFGLNTLTITGAANGLDNGVWNVNGSNLSFNTGTKTFTLTTTGLTCDSGGCGSGNLTNIVSGSALATFTVAASADTAANGSITNANYSTFATSGYNFSGTSQFEFAFGTPTSITTLAALLTDLNMATSNSILTSGGVDSTWGAGSPTTTFTANVASGNTLVVSLSTPEPVSFLLFGSGLIGLAFFARRRSVRN